MTESVDLIVTETERALQKAQRRSFGALVSGVPNPNAQRLAVISNIRSRSLQYIILIFVKFYKLINKYIL